MSIRRVGAICVLLCASPLLAADLPKPMITGLKNPESVCIGPDEAIYISEIGEFNKDGDGQVSVVKEGKAVPFATGLDDPKGIVFANNAFYVTDKTKILRIDREGKVSTFVAADKFPSPPQFLNDIAVDPETGPRGGRLFVSDSGASGKGGVVYRIDLGSARVEKVADAASIPSMNTPNGIAPDGASFLLVLDFGSGELHRVKLAGGSSQKIADGFDGGDGLIWDKFGRLFISSWKTGRIWGIPRPGQKPIQIAEGLESAADFCLDATGRNLLVPDMKAGTLTAIPTTISGWEIDDKPLPIKTAVAFPNLEFTGTASDSGRVAALRPILLTHAGDGSNRVFVPLQQGVIHVFPNDDDATKTSIFLDIKSKIRYLDRQNEEGFLGMAFHPKYKENGEFFVFYTDVKAERPKMANVVSRFRVSKTDPNVADPNSEEEIIRFEKPDWNHDGGTIVFGPDGYLYVTHGDGGAANDPRENGQNLKTLLGKVLRLDIDRKENGKNYAIPKDNPFVGKADVLPEIWAYGLRNIWRMSFDRKTGQLWAGEVGQNIFEEINIIKAGGNYGWNIRESLHPFGAKGVDVRPDLIEPLWEYNHDLGKSITGGLVYRGTKLPELDGAFLYADYVSMHIWALWYDAAKGRVVANREILGHNQQVPSFGEDEKGEPYLLAHAASGRVIYRLVK